VSPDFATCHSEFSLLGVNWVQPSTIKDVFDGLEKKDEEMVSRNFDDDPVGYVVEYLKGE